MTTKNTRKAQKVIYKKHYHVLSDDIDIFSRSYFSAIIYLIKLFIKNRQSVKLYVEIYKTEEDYHTSHYTEECIISINKH